MSATAISWNGNNPIALFFRHRHGKCLTSFKLCHENSVPIVPRGAGTSLAGGCLPIGGGVMITLTKMNQIHEVNLLDRYAIVDAGVVNGRLNRELAGTGYHFAPDPSSGGASTIGGNIATNAGGPHTLEIWRDNKSRARN